MLNKVKVPHVPNEHEPLGLGNKQRFLVVLNVFRGKMIPKIKEVLLEDNILVTNDQSNLTWLYHWLNLTISGSTKRLFFKRFNSWYDDQVSSELQMGKSFNEVEFVSINTELLLFGWLVNFVSLITSSDGKKVIASGWNSLEITESV